MENKKVISPVLIIIAIILGSVLFKQFDYQNLKFEKPGLAIIYFIVFCFCIIVIVKNLRKKQ